MKSSKIGTFFLMVVLCMMILSCGSNGGNKGNTVYITAGAKNSSTFTINTTAISSEGPPVVYNTGSLDYTITSTVYPTTTGIAASAVNITSAQISYKPLLASDGKTMSPSIASWSKAVGPSRVEPGATTDITLTVVDVPQMTAIYEVIPVGLQYRYEVNVRFVGTEINTETSLACDATAGNFYVSRGP